MRQVDVLRCVFTNFLEERGASTSHIVALDEFGQRGLLT